jgi:hypothetical protein
MRILWYINSTKLKEGNMKHIKSIEFVLENCESFNIDANYFGTFLIDDIYYSIQRIASRRTLFPRIFI